jgi:hypothetical protein
MQCVSKLEAMIAIKVVLRRGYIWKERISGADEARVKGASEGDVSGALDDGAAVAEEGDGVVAAAKAEAEEEAVCTDVLDVSVESEAVAHCGEIDRAMTLVDLDGVASAESDVGAAFAGEVGEAALAADAAVGAWGGG